MPDKGLLFAADTLMPGGVMGGVFGSGSIADYIQSLERLKGLNSKILLSGHGRLSDTPQDDVRIAIQRSHGLLSDTAQLFDALDARAEFRADHAVGARPQQARRLIPSLRATNAKRSREGEQIDDAIHLLIRSAARWIASLRSLSLATE